MRFIHNPKTYNNGDTWNQYWIEINIRYNYMNWLHMKLTSFLQIHVHVSQIGNFYWYTLLHIKCRNPLPTNVIISFHNTGYVATLLVLISYKCKYIWTWFKHMFWENIRGINICNNWRTSWKIGVVWLIFTMPFPRIHQSVGVQYVQFYSWNPKTQLSTTHFYQNRCLEPQ